MKKDNCLGENYNGIPENIYLGDEINDEERDPLKYAEEIMWIVLGILCTIVFIAQMVILYQ